MSERELRGKQVLRPADAARQENGGSADAAPEEGNRASGIGLANTRERLRYLYGDRQQFTLDRGILGGLRVRFDLPYHE